LESEDSAEHQVEGGGIFSIQARIGNASEVMAVWVKVVLKVVIVMEFAV
jgi:hypothetical protein